jgi:hypothetical protein
MRQVLRPERGGGGHGGWDGKRGRGRVQEEVEGGGKGKEEGQLVSGGGGDICLCRQGEKAKLSPAAELYTISGA